MTVAFVRETVFPGSGSFLLNTPITLSGSPSAGATLIYTHDANAAASTVASIAGCGATWTKVLRNNSGSVVAEMWVGKECTGTGDTITVTGTVTLAFRANINEWTGLEGTFGTPSSAIGSTSDVDSGSVTPAVGDLVVTQLGDQNSSTITPTDTPDTFTTLTQASSGSYRNASAYRIATSTAAHKRTWARTLSTDWASVTVVFPAAAGVPTTTADLPVAVGLAAVASSIAKSTAVLGLAIGMAAVGSTVATTTAQFPITVGMGATGLAIGAPTTAAFPISVGMGATASTVATTTAGFPVGVGFGVVGDVASSIPTTTAQFPLNVGFSGVASSTLLNILVGSTTLPTLLDITSDAVELGYAPPFAEVDAEGLPPIDTIALPPVVVLPGFPDVIVERPIRRVSVTVPAMAPDADGKVRISDAVYAAYPTVRAEVGVVHTIIGGQDVTYFRGSPLGGAERLESPFGDVSASVSFPAITAQDTPGVGALSWLRHEASFDRIMVHPDGSIRRLWSGHLVADDGGNDSRSFRTVWSASGTLWQASTYGHRVPLTMKPVDRGTVIARSLNGVVGRAYPVLPVIPTGIMTTDRGSSSDSELAYVQGLLSTMWTAAGRQWTIMKTPGTRRTYRLGLKDMTTVHHTFTASQFGVETILSRDMTSTTNCILGHGILPNGYAWSGRVWPNYHPDSTPTYPNADPLNLITVGTTDADTDSGTGVSDWQRQINDLNITPDVVVDGVFNTSDQAVLLTIQRDAGLLIDGILGPQSWQGTFSTGDNNGNLNGSYRRPLAIHTSTEPNTYSASGAITGRNPGYTGAFRWEEDLDFGAGSTRAEATVSSKLKLARDRIAGYTGTLTLLADSREDSRFFIIPNQNVKLVGYNGRDVLLHVVSVDRNYDTLTVTLTVDEKARDAMTVASIRERDKAAKVDPGRRPGFTPRRSRLDPDLTAGFDGESEAGIVRSTAIIPGLWIPIRFPLSTVGSLAKIDLQTTPPTRFAFALFNSLNVEPAHLVVNVGNPLSGTEPFARTDAKGDALDALGLINAWGEQGSACGYGLKAEGSGALSGRFTNTSPQTYNAIEEASVTLMAWADGPCHISGRFWPSPIQ